MGVSWPAKFDILSGFKQKPVTLPVMWLRKVKRSLSELIRKQAEACHRQDLGDGARNALSDDEREEKLCLHMLDCHHHSIFV